MSKPRVAIVFGSDSDWPVMEQCVAKLRTFELNPSVQIISAHRNPDRVADFAKRAEGEGTFSGFKPGGVRGPRIDWIGAKEHWKVTSASIDRTSKDGRTPSDHFPVTAVLQRRAK